MIKAVIFDNDGIIVNSIPLHYEAWRRLLAEHGVELTMDEFNKLNGMTTPEILRHRREQFNLNYNIEEMANKKRVLADELLKERVELCDGVSGLLKLLKENGIKTAIATSAYLSTIEIILNKFPIRSLFDAIVTMEDYEHGKPAPDVFLKAAEKLNIPPEECMVVEDAKTGIKAAKAAGMKCLAVTNSFPESELSNADIVVGSLSEVDMDFIRKLR